MSLFYIYRTFPIFLILLVISLTACENSNETGIRVSALTPRGAVGRTTNLTATFSNALAPDSLIDVLMDNDVFSFQPALPGKIRWIAPDELRFYPDIQLAPSTDYEVSIAANVQGRRIAGERSFEVHTPYLRVEDISVNFEFTAETNETADLVASLSFSEDVNPADLQRYVSIESDDNQGMEFEIRTTEPGKVVQLTAFDVPRADMDKRIRLIVEKDLPAVAGNHGLAQRVVEPATLPGQVELRVFSLHPVRESATQGYVRMDFSIPIDPERAATFIEIDPAVDVRVSAQHTSLFVRGPFRTDESYKITLRRGLEAIDGTDLDRNFTNTVTFRKEDIPAQIDFVGSGYYLTRSGHLNVGLSTINTNKVTIEIEKVFANNLVYLLNTRDLSDTYDWYYYGSGMETLGREILSTDLAIANVPNDEIVTPLSVADYLADERNGVFKITARDTEERWRSASKWVVATEMGLIAKRSGEELWVWVNGLSSLDPITGASVKLYSRNNQLLAETASGADGLAVLKGSIYDQTGLEPYLVVAEQGEDVSFLELTRHLVETSEFDVGGSPYLLSGFDAYLFDERGVYRPGETVHLASVVREEGLRSPEPLPVILRVNGPDGRTFSEQRALLNPEGVSDYEVDVPAYARTGRYTAQLLVAGDQEIGRHRFSVEEFIPDRMRVAVRTDQETYPAGERATIEVDGVTLFGPPASGRRVDLALELEAYPFAPNDWQRFSFVDETRTFDVRRFEVASATLDAEGHYQHIYKLPADIEPPSSIRGVVSASVVEPGGRAVTAYSGFVVHPHANYVGLRRVGDGYGEPGRASDFEFVSVDYDGNALAGRSIEVTTTHIYWHSILKEVDGRYRYVSEQVEEVVSRQQVSSQQGPTRFSFTPEDYGRFRVEVRDINSGAKATSSFYASGWGYAPWAMDAPERLELDLDKPSYKVGERATVQIRSPFPGKLLLTVERDQVIERHVVVLDENTATIELRVDPEMKPNAYVSGILIRSTDGLERDTPVRAFGIVPLMIENDDNRLDVSVTVANEMRPLNQLHVEVSVEGGRSGFVAIAAVDEGILQLTDFQTPDPFAHFLGKKALGVLSYDMYGNLLPEIPPRVSSPSGDVETARKRQLSPQTARRVKPVTFWSGWVALDRRGRGKVTFDVPQFNGTVRVMAVAVREGRFGSAAEEVLVRDPLVLTPTFPRFLAPGDKVKVPVSIFNGTSSDQTVTIELDASGPVRLAGSATQTVEVPRERESLIYFDVQVSPETGTASFDVSARGSGVQTASSAEVPVRAPLPFLTFTGSGSIEPNTTELITLPGNITPETSSFEVVVSAFPEVQFSKSLQYLLRYPHGCVEQTTSKAFPLLYFDDMVADVEPDLFQANSAGYFVDQAIGRLEDMQQESGGFSYWPGGTYVNEWATIYATHFLTEARRSGHLVADAMYDRAIKSVESIARSYRGTETYSYQPIVYAAYVLALSGNPDRPTNHFVRNNVIDRLSAYSQAQLAGAYALSGDRQTAEELLPRKVTVSDASESGGNFNSPLRSQAILLEVLVDINPSHPNIPILVREISEALNRPGARYSTQGNAFAFLALGKALRGRARGEYTGSFSAPGGPEAEIGSETARFSSDSWDGENISVAIQGNGSAYYYWRADGIPTGRHTEEFDRDLVVRRRYLRENGTAISSAEALRQGDLIVAEISISASADPVDNVAIVDMLPAGLEIENPRLESRQAIRWIPEQVFAPEYVDIRDDRIVIYGRAQRGEARKYYYALRAVTAGEFVLPPVRAEAMYAPEKASVASSGAIRIVTPDVAAGE